MSSLGPTIALLSLIAAGCIIAAIAIGRREQRPYCRHDRRRWCEDCFDDWVEEVEGDPEKLFYELED